MKRFLSCLRTVSCVNVKPPACTEFTRASRPPGGKSPCTDPEIGRCEDFWENWTLNMNDTDCFFPPVFYLNFPHFLLCSWCYRCHCPPQFDGPDCQQTRLRFLGNGYAWFPPIRPCFDSHLSLEFMTEEDEGLLLYTGPLTTLLPGEAEDFIAIGNDWIQIIRCVPLGLGGHRWTETWALILWV